jgi:LmbE family N-acetylglucosaminyl deacetylase
MKAPARRNDPVVCRDAPEPVGVSVRPDGFELPDSWARRGETAFVALEVEATLTGRVREPRIEVRWGGVTHHQSFDRGARGLRHLNLSPVLQEGATDGPSTLGLRGEGMRWQTQGWLTSFEPPASTDGTILVLAPHPDDAELAAFGLYADRPASSWIVTVTAGERGAMNLSKVIASRAGGDTPWKASLRVWDSVMIPQLAGVSAERCLNLAYPDGGLEAMFRHAAGPHRLACEPALSRSTLRARNRDREFQEAPSECTWAGLVSDLRLLIDKAKPAVVVCPHPLVDSHPDHVFTTVALEQALRESAHRAPAFFLYVVHARDAHAYPYGSGDAIVSLPPSNDARWLADSIYSHPLPADRRRGKYFAVEAAHDVRTYGNGGARTFRQLLGAMKREASAFVRGVAVDPMGAFLRRASRPNEIYYVVCADSLSELVTAVRRTGDSRAYAPESRRRWPSGFTDGGGSDSR